MFLRLVLARWALALGGLAYAGTEGPGVSAGHQVPRHPIQIIGAGLSRTATQSLALALTELGFKTLHAEGFHPEIPVGRGTPLTATITAAARRFFKGEGFQVLDPALQLVSDLGIDAVVDLPWSECTSELLQQHPQAKVIVTVRDSAAGWYRSYWEHFRWASVFPPGLTPRFIDYWRHVTNKTGCRFVTRWPPWYPTEHEEADCIQAYDRRIELLKSTVPRESLLIFNLKAGWGPLCQFLGRDVPKRSFPHSDAYTFLHWHAGPNSFLAAVYAAYGAIFYCLWVCTCWLSRGTGSRRRSLARKRA